MPEWSVLLLGGTAAAGKSTSARKIARLLGIGCISGDSLWKAILAITTPETHPVLHQWPRAEVALGDPEDLTALHITEAQVLTPAIEAFIDHELQERNRFVFHAAWITPHFAARKCAAANDIRTVFIDEQNAESILQSMVARSGRRGPSERQTVMANVQALYGRWLKEEAEKRGLLVVSAQPRESLVDRIIAAAG